MITACILGTVALVGFRYCQHLIDVRRRSAVFIVDEGRERWVVDFTAHLVYPKMYYRRFKIPHSTNRDLSQDYDLREITQPRGFCGVHMVEASTWEMRLTRESWDGMKRDALGVLEETNWRLPKSDRKKAKKVLEASWVEPRWELVPEWLTEILNARYEVFRRYLPSVGQHPGRVEDLEPYLTQDMSLARVNP